MGYLRRLLTIRLRVLGLVSLELRRQRQRLTVLLSGNGVARRSPLLRGVKL
jgi:hypothetical protein